MRHPFAASRNNWQYKTTPEKWRSASLIVTKGAPLLLSNGHSEIEPDEHCRCHRKYVQSYGRHLCDAEKLRRRITAKIVQSTFDHPHELNGELLNCKSHFISWSRGYFTWHHNWMRRHVKKVWLQVLDDSPPGSLNRILDFTNLDRQYQSLRTCQDMST